MKKCSKKTLKKVLACLGGIAFITLCVYNFMLGLSDYGKISTSGFTLEALATGEASCSEASIPTVCLELQQKVDGKREKKTGKYCWLDKDGKDQNEGEIIECTSDNAFPSSKCNETKCITSIAGCSVGDKKQK
jgi:hypothetical protein